MDRELIERKLEELSVYLKELQRFRGKSLEELKASLSTSWAVEHGLQLAIQALLDIGSRILASLDERGIEDYGDVIDKLGERMILPAEFARGIRGMAGFRNVLVHEYAEVELATVHDVLNKRLEDFERFIRHIQKYLASWESGT